MGLLISIFTFPEAPGYRVAVVVAETSTVVSAWALVAFAYPAPLSRQLMDLYDPALVSLLIPGMVQQ